MERRSALIFTTTAVLLLVGLAPLAAAHGDDEGEEHAAASMKMPAAPESAAGPQTYFRHPEHVTAILAHSALMVLAWVFALPIAIALSVARSRYSILAQIAFLVVNALGLVTGVVYNTSTPDLYANNKHHPIGWVITWIATAWVVLSVLARLGGAGSQKQRQEQQEHQRKSSGQPVTQAAMAMFRRFHDSSPTRSELEQDQEHRWSGDSGQGTERNTASLCPDSRTNSFGSGSSEAAPGLVSRTHAAHVNDDDDDDEDMEESETDEFEKRSFLRSATVDRFFPSSIGGGRGAKKSLAGLRRFARPFGMAKVVLDKMMLLLGFIGLISGGIVYGGIMNGSSVFNGLAHFIKGGIFFWYGFLCLGRWMGCFADFGWAWNRKPPKEIVGKWCARMPSAEFVESAVIAFYGVSNVGLEHLANTDGKWAAIDLEHVSITLMFFGGGLLGMLIESTTVRDLLQATIHVKRDECADTLAPSDSFDEPEQWRFSMNPMPALIITLLGIMMGSHHQASMVSTMMHKQWGNLFAGFGLARIATYVVMYLRGPVSYLPQRPPTEVVSSFCLMAGGILFMLSNKDTVAALEYNKLDAMFIFNVVMGFNAFIMAWGAICMAVKGFAQRSEARRLRPVRSPA